jgi:hypothetical protein
MIHEKAFKDDLSLSKVRDILWAFTGRDFYRMLVLSVAGHPMNMKNG